MSVQSEIDRIITAVGNAYSKVSEKGGTVPSSQTVANLATAIDSIPSGGAKETWVIKSNAAGEFATTQISFTSNGQKFTSIGANSDYGLFVLRYDNNEVAGYDPAFGGEWYEFDNEAYRTIIFDTAPTGALLTWLQSNATKQTSGVSLQQKSVTYTSNGTNTITSDAGYDGLSSVDVTADVSGGGGATEPYIEETYDSNGNLIDAKLYGYTNIRNYAFYGCEKLALTSLPAGIRSISKYAFYFCKNLALTSLHAGIRFIEYSAFGKCTNLTSITFEGKPLTIDSGAFIDCTNLTTINVPWARGAVSNAPWGATNATINYNYTGG